MDAYNFQVNDRQSFIRFLELFREDLIKSRWANCTLEDFLGAMASYSEDIQGYYNNMNNETINRVDADVASWRVFADILRGSTCTSNFCPAISQGNVKVSNPLEWIS